MVGVIMTVCLIGACLSIAFGVAVFPRKLRDCIETTRPNPERHAQVVADTLAELLRNEIDATKRGDLLAAAGFAERAEVIRG
ncbi:hypothetical protein [Stenotrophomonas rhizophila]|uniref:hypothetical protein n=1 Tax=Stenotrophomonas rhizophila TaxID=216778 RepID=UPI001E338020|nr:hypothetical protein [Stenotrophomonas rhizophila]MCC7635356.1 hypothetical protein [Stenotrophomonas rhizophila]MCC7664415.1 hypothetical protein [Stenotrophomonas rhizophila]